MGNTLQLIFSSGNYFRFKDLELVTDSHFGHLTPIVYARLWKLFVTSSFTASQRIGISGIEELSTKKLEQSDREVLAQKPQRQLGMTNNRIEKEEVPSTTFSASGDTLFNRHE